MGINDGCAANASAVIVFGACAFGGANDAEWDGEIGREGDGDKEMGG